MFTKRILQFTRHILWVDLCLILAYTRLNVMNSYFGESPKRALRKIELYQAYCELKAAVDVLNYMRRTYLHWKQLGLDPDKVYAMLAAQA